MSLPVMKIRLPGTIESDQGITVVLADGRQVHIWPSGEISVRSHENQLGSEDYYLELPAVEYEQANCPDRSTLTGNGQVMIPVVHRH
jgi:hypothetical protein